MKPRLFFCYSKRLKKALVDNGFTVECTGYNCHTHSKFWLFIGTQELNNYKDNYYQKERDNY